MKKKDLNSLNGKSAVELEGMAHDFRLQISKANMDLVAHRAKNTNAVKNLKKTLAQILTFKTQTNLNK